MPEVVAKINPARAQGIDVTADTYAYPAWSNSLSAFMPQWAHDGGDDKLVERLKDPALARAFAKNCSRRSTSGTTSGMRFPARKRFWFAL